VDRERGDDQAGNRAGLPRSLGEAAPVLLLCCWRGYGWAAECLLPPSLPEQHDGASEPTTTSDGDGQAAP
jgi:hypothetical protein